MTTPFLKELILGTLTIASAPLAVRSQEPFPDLVLPPLQQATRPLLLPTDLASGPIAYHGPERLQSKLTRLAHDTLAEMATAWCDTPIDLPITPMHVTLLSKGVSGQARMEFANGKMSAATVVVNGDMGGLEKAIKHEMTHLVLRARCGLNLPRWFDEGCASLSEGQATLDTFRHDLVTNYLVTGRGISFHDLFMTVDPPTGTTTMPFYAQSTTLVAFLLEHAPGETLTDKRHHLLRFIRQVIQEGASMEAYQRNVQRYFGFPKVSALQNEWLTWLQSKG